MGTLYLIVTRTTAGGFLLSRGNRHIFGIGGKCVAHLWPTHLGNVDPVTSPVVQNLWNTKKCHFSNYHSVCLHCNVNLALTSILSAHMQVTLMPSDLSSLISALDVFFRVHPMIQMLLQAGFEDWKAAALMECPHILQPFCLVSCWPSCNLPLCLVSWKL